eukprot:5503909-Prorocentrum_lima.AAC.1
MTKTRRIEAWRNKCSRQPVLKGVSLMPGKVTVGCVDASLSQQPSVQGKRLMPGEVNAAKQPVVKGERSMRSEVNAAGFDSYHSRQAL